MITHRAGVSVIALAFLIIAIAVGGFAWFQQNVLSGTRISQETIENLKLDKVDLELKNARLFLSEALYDAAANASYSIAQQGGRNATNVTVNETTGNVTKEFNERFLYWRCDKREVHNSQREVQYQIPTPKRVQLALQNHTMRYMAQWIRHLHGIRDNVIYEVGQNLCSLVGYNTPRDVPTNDKFKTAGLISKLSTGLDKFKRIKHNITLVNEVKYNRFWYMYEILKQWTNEQNMQQKIKEEMAKVPDYTHDWFCGGCPCPYKRGCEEIPEVWTVNITEAVDRGVKKTVNTLMEPQYFDSNQVTCGYSITDEYYDSEKTRLIQVPVGWCPGLHQRLWYCRLNYGYRAEVDVDVSCTDQRFKSIPQKDLKRQQWRIRLNVEASEQKIHKLFPPPCESVANPQCDDLRAPWHFGNEEFQKCVIPDENPQLCSTGVDVTGTLPQDEIKQNLD